MREYSRAVRSQEMLNYSLLGFSAGQQRAQGVMKNRTETEKKLVIVTPPDDMKLCNDNKLRQLLFPAIAIFLEMSKAFRCKPALDPYLCRKPQNYTYQTTIRIVTHSPTA